jgi:hypothetical protein
MVVGTVKRIVCEVDVEDGHEVEIVSLTRESTAASATRADPEKEKVSARRKNSKKYPENPARPE